MSYDDLRNSDAFESKPLRRLASVGTFSIMVFRLNFSVAGDSVDICSARTSVGSSRSSIGSAVELPSRPQGLSVKDWRNIGMTNDFHV